MTPSTLKKTLTSKLLILALPLLLVLGVVAPSAQARDHHDGRRHAYRHGHGRRDYGGRGYYRHRGYGDRRHHGYWRRYHGRRYWYEDGGYYTYPGGVSISIGL